MKRLALVAAVLVVAACGKKDEAPADTSAMTPPPSAPAMMDTAAAKMDSAAQKIDSMAGAAAATADSMKKH